MDGLRFPVTIHLHGTLAANAQGVVSAADRHDAGVGRRGASNDSDATLQLGLATMPTAS